MEEIQEEKQRYRKVPAPAFFEPYLRYLAFFKNRQERTLASIDLSLREFCQYIRYRNTHGCQPENGQVYKEIQIQDMTLAEMAAVTERDIEEYQYFLHTVVLNQNVTIRRKISYLRHFYQYLYDQQTELDIQLSENPVKKIPAPPPKEATLRILSSAEIQTLLDNVTGINETRDKAIIQLILTTGAMLKEVADLNIEDYTANTIKLRGRTTREVPLSESCILSLERYLTEYRDPLEESLRDKALFVSSIRRKRLTSRCIEVVINKHMVNAKLAHKGYTANSLRDTAIVFMLNAFPAQQRTRVLEFLGFRSRSSKARFTAYLQEDTIFSKLQMLDITDTI